jgi:transposase
VAVETDPDKMMAVMLGIPGSKVIELRLSDDAADLLIEIEDRSVDCPECGGRAEPAGRVLEDLVPSSISGKLARVTWRRRRWHCPSPGCGVDVFVEEDEGVVAFNNRVAAANRRMPLPRSSTPASDWRDRLEE